MQLGEAGTVFQAHEYVLNRSPRLTAEIAKSRTKARRTQQTVLQVMPHDPKAFEQMIEYLYKDKFTLQKGVRGVGERMMEFKELMSLAKFYGLPGLQGLVVGMFQKGRFMGKLNARSFFDWAEDMYYEELDHESGPFKAFFSRAAPVLIRGMAGEVLEEVLGMVQQGGGFAKELFKASLTVWLFACLSSVWGTNAAETGYGICDCEARAWGCEGAGCE